MDPVGPNVGEHYVADGPLIAQNRGIHRKSEWVVSNCDDDKVSLSVYAGNPGGWSKVTIHKAFFGQNFTLCPGANVALHRRTYAVAEHFHLDVDIRTSLLPV